MKAIIGGIVGVYQLLYRFYPTAFRREFRDEARHTFADQLEGAAELGFLALLRASLRELVDLPAGVVREHWLQLRQGEASAGRMMEPATVTGGAGPTLENGSRPGTWQDALLASYPYLVLAGIFSILFLVYPNIPLSGARSTVEIIAVSVAWLLVGTFLVMLVFAWRRGWPRWSASYYLMAFLAVVFTTLLILQVQDNAQMYRLMDFLLGAGFVILWVVFIYLVILKDAVKGLLVIAPIAILYWWLVLEFVPGNFRNPLQVGMFAITALAVFLITRLGSWRKGIWIILISTMLVGMPVAYFRTFFHNIPPQHADPSTIGMLGERYAVGLFWSTLLVIGPMLVWLLWQLSRGCGTEGVWGYRLAVSGLLINLVLNLFSWNGYVMSRIPFGSSLELAFSALIGLSAGIYLTGILLLFFAGREEGLLADKGTSLLFVLVALGLPIVFMFPMFEIRQFRPTNLPFGLFEENNVPETLVYSLGVLWLFLGAWLITRLKVPGRGSSRHQNLV